MCHENSVNCVCIYAVGSNDAKNFVMLSNNGLSLIGNYAGSNAGPMPNTAVTLQLLLLTNMETGSNNQ